MLYCHWLLLSCVFATFVFLVIFLLFNFILDFLDQKHIKRIMQENNLREKEATEFYNKFGPL